MTFVCKPTDVAVGDLVEYHAGNRAARVAEVTRASTTRLTVKFSDGETLTAAYTRKKQTGGVLSRTYIAHNFTRLDAQARWWHRQPKTPDVDPARGAAGSCPTLVVNAVAWRDRPGEVTAQLNLLCGWLREEPPKGAR